MLGWAGFVSARRPAPAGTGEAPRGRLGFCLMDAGMEHIAAAAEAGAGPQRPCVCVWLF